MAEANEINSYFIIYFIGYDVSFVLNVISILDMYIILYYFGNTRLSGPPITSKG